jgi:copper(I)-binding protein
MNQKQTLKTMTKNLRRLALLLAATLPLSLLAAESELTVTDHYVRMVPPGIATSGAFMTIKNSGNTDRKLLKVDSPAAKTVELHTHINDNGMMKMRPVKEIDVKAHGQAELKPGGYHVMLIDLKQALKEGETVPLTLTFDDGSTKKINAPIKRP